jgi:glycosyltransferase involved in cell wall biosynthesis
MVAYHFPPLAGSSGIQRTLRFARHLPDAGWEPLVLTTIPGAYERTSPDLDAEIPRELIVRRAFALDAARQLSVLGRYPRLLARPDRWATWRFDAVRVGMRMIRTFRPDAIWSTYPIATAHCIGQRLHDRSGLPWVADFRDPMAQVDYPEEPQLRELFRRIESAAIASAACSVFTTPGAAREYARRYPQRAACMRVIENGYDEESFAAVEQEAAALGALQPGRLTLLHSGIVYPSERDPSRLLQALGQLKQSGRLDAARLSVRFRAAVHNELLRDLAQRYDVADLVEIAPPIGYRAALLEMLRADGLLVLQASNCNDQIPAKIYEYLRARRPLLALTDPAGDTAQALRAAGVGRVAQLDRADEIARLLEEFAAGPALRASLLPQEAAVRGASRAARARELAAALDGAVAAP